MTKPTFNNTPNEVFRMRYDTNDKGRISVDYWISRAPSVNGVIFAFGVEGGVRVLVVKRSKNMRDEPLKYCLPCGYLDWDETGYEGVTREVYEETTLYLPDLEPFLVNNNCGQPFYINTDPKSNRQNVSLNYLLIFDFLDGQDFFPEEIEKHTNSEVVKVKWLKVSELHTIKNWAFNHDERIKQALKFYNKGMK